MASRDEIERAYELGNGTSHYDGLKAVYDLGRDDQRKLHESDPVVERGYFDADPPAEAPVKTPKKKGK